MRDVESAYAEAKGLVPALEEAQRAVSDTELPALESEKRWREAESLQRDIQDRVNRNLGELEASCTRVLGLPASRNTPQEVVSLSPTEDMILHHMDHRMSAFLQHEINSGKKVQVWKVFPGNVRMNAFHGLGDGHLGTQVGCCCIDEKPYLIGCISVSMSPLENYPNHPRGFILHWSVTDHASGAWLNSIPKGWHTYPGISQAQGATAWQTHFAHYNPVLSTKEAWGNLSLISVHSVVVQIPMEGHFEHGGGIKYVLKRAEGYGEAWIKSKGQGDMYLSFDQAIAYLNPPPSPVELPRGVDTDQDDESPATWTWARALAQEIVSSQSFDDSNGLSSYNPSFLWLEQIAAWTEITDYAMNTGSSLAQYVSELRLLLDILWRQGSVQGSGYEDQKEIFYLRDKCSKLEADIQALDAAEMKSRQHQLEKDRLWEMRDVAIKESARVQHEVEKQIGIARKNLVSASGRETEIVLGDLKGLCSTLVLGDEDGRERGAGLFKSWLGGPAPPVSHVFVSESIEKVDAIDAHVVTHVYFEGEREVVDAATAQNSDEATSPSGEEKSQTSVSPFDTVIVSIAFGESFPGRLSTSSLSLHYGLVTHKHGKWIQEPGTAQVAIQRADEEGCFNFEAFRIKHKDGGSVFVDPILRGLCIRFPADDLRMRGIKGIEFVLRSDSDHWLQKEGLEKNFFIHVPLMQ